MEKGKERQRDLADMVFSWSLEDVLTKQLLKDKVEQIPNTFQSTQQYFQSFVYPLIEETHADLYSSMETIAQAPLLKVLPGAKSKSRNEEFVYNLNVMPQRSGLVEGGKETYIPSNEDILVFSEMKPADAADLNREGRSFVLGVITGIKGPQFKPPYKITLKVSKQVAFPIDRKQCLFAVYMINIKTNNRIWKALNSYQGMQRNLDVISSFLDVDSMVGRSCVHCSTSTQDTNVESMSLRYKLMPFSLNGSQTDAVLSAVAARQCNHQHSVKIIWGPPGTGKTKTITTLLWVLMTMKCRTLTCAPTNVAVLEVASRLLRLVNDSSGNGICSLGDVLLFGNKDRMDIDVNLQDIFLDHRIKKLTECFAPMSGWSHQVDSMIGLLESCVHRYQLYLKSENEENCSLAFPVFVRNKLSPIAKALTENIRIMSTHLPTGFLSDKNFELMTSVGDLLQSFENLLCNVADAELEGLFMQSDEVISMKLNGGSINGSLALLCNIRHECLCILRILRESLQIPPLLEKGRFQDFCFKSATLIFCTASASFKLHSVKMEPLELLIMDEAAQLKECESTISLQLLAIKHAILIGDERQLPAMVKSKIAEKAGFGRSLFERLSSLGHAKQLLDVQYRMHPSICSFPNTNFYKKQILNAPNVKNENYRRQYLPGQIFGSYSFINILYGKEMYDNGHSPKKCG